MNFHRKECDVYIFTHVYMLMKKKKKKIGLEINKKQSFFSNYFYQWV